MYLVFRHLGIFVTPPQDRVSRTGVWLKAIGTVSPVNMALGQQDDVFCTDSWGVAGVAPGYDAYGLWPNASLRRYSYEYYFALRNRR